MRSFATIGHFGIITQLGAALVVFDKKKKVSNPTGEV